MSPERQKARQREISAAHYQANREKILERQQARRKDPVENEKLRTRERERLADLSPEERERRTQLNRDWYRSNPRPNAKNVEQHLKHRYGITPQDRERMLLNQGGCCYLCGDLLDLAQPRKVHVDHDHACCPGTKTCGKCIRGIACDPCNRGVGYFRDDPQRMRRVADALEAVVMRTQAATSVS